jgi:hypothetical protein
MAGLKYRKSEKPQNPGKNQKTRGKTQKPNYPSLFLENPGFLPTLIKIKF